MTMHQSLTDARFVFTSGNKMIQKKICLLGAFSVGKTSLIQRYVNSLFEDKYLTTVGVKVDKKELVVETETVKLMIWDLAGEDDYSSLQKSYLRGAAGYILVIDGTRPGSLDTAIGISSTVKETLGDIPFVTALNKADLEEQWRLTESALTELNANFSPLKTSAKTGQNVEQLFHNLATMML